MKNSNTSTINIFVTACIALTLCALVSFPFFLSPAAVCCIYVCSVPYLMALFRLRRICITISSDNPFSEEASKDFSFISRCAFCEVPILPLCFSAFYVIEDVAISYLRILVPAALLFLCIFTGLLSSSASAVFRHAHEMKEENDLIF